MIQSLAAVRDAVGGALHAAAQALAASAPDAADVAQRHWQSAHAAMQMVDHRALVKFSTELGALIGADAGVAADRAAAFASGSEALMVYVGALIAGRRDQPLRLWPAYQTVQQARGVTQPLQSDLFFPDINVGPGERTHTSLLNAPMNADELRATRRLLEGGLLQWLRKGERAGLEQINQAVTRVEASLSDGAARRLWWVASAVLDALLHDGLKTDAQVRRLITQLNLHLGRLLQGPAATPEPLMREVLYLAARAQPVTALVSDVQRLCGLHGALAVEEAAPSGFSTEAVADVRQKMEGLHELWSACAAGAAKAAEFEYRARAAADACAALGEPALTALLVQLAESANGLARAGVTLNETTALEGACALLMVEQVLAAEHAPEAGFAARATHVAARLTVSVDTPQALSALPPAQWLDDDSRQARSARHVVVANAQIAHELRDIEHALELWFGDTSNPGLVVKLDKPLRQIAGALHVMGHADVAALAEQCRAEIAGYAQGKICSEAESRQLSRRLTVLSAFIGAQKHGAVKLDSVLEHLAITSPLGITPATVAATPVVEVLQALSTLTMPAIPVTPVVPVVPVAPLVTQALEITPPAPAAPASQLPIDGAGDTDPEMLDIFLEEASEVLGTIAGTTPQSRAQPTDQEHLTTLRRAFHTLKGSGRMVGLKHIGEAAWEMEQVMNDRQPQQQPGTPDIYRLIDYAHERFTQWIDTLRAHKPAPIDASRLVAWARSVRAGEALPAEPDFATAVTLPVVVGVPEARSDIVKVGEITVSRTLYEIMLPEARQNIEILDAQNRQLQAGAKVDAAFLRAAHTLSGIAGTAGFAAIRTLGASLEHALEAVAAGDRAPSAETRALIARGVFAMSAQVNSIGELKAPAEHGELADALNRVQTGRDEIVAQTQAPAVLEAAPMALTVTTVAAVAPAAPVDSAAVTGSLVPSTPGVERRRYRVNDDLDSQLLPIFLEEAAELVPQVGHDLRAWRARPEDKLVQQSLKRLLHTLKGSARMAGAMALGQLTHSMESRIENAQLLPLIPGSLIDDLETSFDRIGVLIGRLQGVETITKKFEAMPLSQAKEMMSRTMQIATVTGVMTQSIPVQTTESGAVVPGLPRPLIRVRADLIDRLANQAGEVSIARARVSAELRSARGSLRDLTENVSRLRAQLRELEIQAETQMQSRFSPTPEKTGGKFDPLEFDRFTRLQELTRLMAESVNDVATVQQSLARDLDEGEKALAAQALTTRDVQQDLMAIRMVPFSSVSDRLYRVTRLSAKDSDKRVELDIVGEQVEVDRSVMDRIAPPIEHLLRNAIVHGVEAPKRRIEIGKPEAGVLKLEVRQEGNEVVLSLSDDGDGLNIERIREKAIHLGLMRDDEQLNDHQIGNFIFRSGFSTAGAITAEAGRGVGMDVVMSEITALGGRVSTAFKRGQGTTFTIHLPLTLSVLQSVVMRLGGNYYAVPTMMVEQVQRLKTEVLAAANAAREIEWQGAAYPFHHLAALLDMGEGDETPQYGSVILLRSGANRAAIQVDDIVGGQEIVIKNIGPQLARVPGVTGAAVLGSGETVLILNPVLLSQRYLEAAAAVKAIGLAPALPAAVVEPERQRSVLVVDDSLTVRKITGRLLTREGYLVVVAKDGIEALEKMRDQVPDVMITDVEMPRMDGFDLARNVRADDSLKGLPIIMITSRTADKHRQHASALGVDVFLGKPYEESELLGHIATLARRAVVV